VIGRFVAFRAAILMAAVALSSHQSAAQRITVARPVGYRLTFIGDKVSVDARVVDDAGRPIANAALTYHIADPTIASVSTRGEVTARSPGNTKVWAVSGRDSTSSPILVEPWASKFAFTPAAVRLDALGTRQVLKVFASDAGGVPIAGGTNKASSCRSMNNRIATWTVATGEISAVGNGSTYIRCADRGIADSVKVDVQQRAVTFFILNKQSFRGKLYGDTFTVRTRALDRQGKELFDARPTWASLNPAAVSVDPITGRARAVNNGEAKILVQIGDIADSTTISVSGSPAFQIQKDPLTAIDPNASKSKASVSTQNLSVTESELDTAMVSVVATDSAGASIPNPKFRFHLADTSIARRIDSVRVVGRKPGSTRLIVEYGSHVDSSSVIYVNSKGSMGAVAANSAADASVFVPPGLTWSRDSTPPHLKNRLQIDNLIHTDPRTTSERRTILFSVNGAGAIVDHLSHPKPDETEDRGGVLAGGIATATLYRVLELGGAFRTGALATAGTIGESLTITEAEGSLGIFPLKQVGIRAGYMLRNEETLLSKQAWTIPKISLVTRFAFIGDVVNTFVAFSLLPKATYTGSAPTESPSLSSRAGEAGLEFRYNAFNAGVTYYVEQFTFDNSPRVEDFSAIRLRLGFQKGW